MNSPNKFVQLGLDTSFGAYCRNLKFPVSNRVFIFLTELISLSPVSSLHGLWVSPGRNLCVIGFSFITFCLLFLFYWNVVDLQWLFIFCFCYSLSLTSPGLCSVCHNSLESSLRSHFQLLNFWPLDVTLECNEESHPFKLRQGKFLGEESLAIKSGGHYLKETFPWVLGHWFSVPVSGPGQRLLPWGLQRT